MRIQKYKPYTIKRMSSASQGIEGHSFSDDIATDAPPWMASTKLFARMREAWTMVQARRNACRSLARINRSEGHPSFDSTDTRFLPLLPAKCSSPPEYVQVQVFSRRFRGTESISLTSVKEPADMAR